MLCLTILSKPVRCLLQLMHLQKLHRLHPQMGVDPIRISFHVISKTSYMRRIHRLNKDGVQNRKRILCRSPGVRCEFRKTCRAEQREEAPRDIFGNRGPVINVIHTNEDVADVGVEENCMKADRYSLILKIGNAQNSLSPPAYSKPSTSLPLSPLCRELFAQCLLSPRRIFSYPCQLLFHCFLALRCVLSHCILPPHGILFQCSLPPRRILFRCSLPPRRIFSQCSLSPRRIFSQGSLPPPGILYQGSLPPRCIFSQRILASSCILLSSRILPSSRILTQHRLMLSHPVLPPCVVLSQPTYNLCPPCRYILTVLILFGVVTIWASMGDGARIGGRCRRVRGWLEFAREDSDTVHSGTQGCTMRR